MQSVNQSRNKIDRFFVAGSARNGIAKNVGESENVADRLQNE